MTMQVGINFPYMDYGKDFGRIGSKPPVWLGRIDKELQQFKNDGIFAVRWFILCDGEIFGNQCTTARVRNSKNDL